MKKRIVKILGLEEHYMISNYGEVFRINRINFSLSELRLNLCADGYSRIMLSANNIKTVHFVHRLVLEAFRGVSPIGMECCHNDGDKRNNRLDNLRWDTRRANADDRIKHGNIRKKLDIEKIINIRLLYKNGHTQRELAKIFNISQVSIGRIVRNEVWKN